jgi:hypothetical protein
LPRIDELLDQLNGSRYFSSLDLTSAYWQVRLSPEDVPETAFVTHQGLYEFKVLCFGLCNAPSTFQQLINEVFPPQLRSFVLAYLDDLLVFSKTLEEHMQHLRTVLDKLRQYKLFANLKKSSFLQNEVKFLGHLVGEFGIKPNPAKIQLVQDWPVPQSVSDIQKFLGLTNYLRRYIQGYSVLCKPLTDLLQKGTVYFWSKQCQEAFLLLKKKKS